MIPHSILPVSLLFSLTAVDAFTSINLHHTTTTTSSVLFAEEEEWNNNKPLWKGDKGIASYSDDWLLNFHNKEQNKMQTYTNDLSVWNEQQQEEQVSIKEWQDAFQRNNLADFTPPMSFGLNCLMIGGDVDSEYTKHGGKVTKTDTPPPPQQPTKLPWESEPEADITNMQVVIPQKMYNDDDEETTTYSPIQTRLVDNNEGSSTATAGLRVPSKEAAVYDCIVDQGLLGAVLLSADDTGNKEETVKELLSEASLALREHGIYVLNTLQMTPETMELLNKYSQEAGFEWAFSLDGISNNAAQVSVGRRFNTGEMPKVGRLSRYQV